MRRRVAVARRQVATRGKHGREKNRSNGSSIAIRELRLEPDRPPLVWPSHRKINKTLETVAARQASLDCGKDPRCFQAAPFPTPAFRHSSATCAAGA